MLWGASWRPAAGAAGLSQEQLAELTTYSRSTIANAEAGRQRVSPQFWARCDAALGTGTALARGREEISGMTRRGEVETAAAARQDRMATGRAAGSGTPGAATTLEVLPGTGQLESLRVRLDGALGEGTVTGAVLDAWAGSGRARAGDSLAAAR